MEEGLYVKSTKGGKPRPIDVDSYVLDVLRDHQREQEEHRALYGGDYRSDLNLVFARPDGYYYSPNKLGTRIKAALRKAGLGNLSLHSLRHTHASQLLSDGTPVAVVSGRLGHANPNITYTIYAHAMPPRPAGRRHHVGQRHEGRHRSQPEGGFGTEAQDDSK